MRMTEGKQRENLRYLGYTLGIVAAGTVALLMYLLLAPLLEILMLIALIAGTGLFILIAVASVFYLFISKDRK
jgi:hypothetical protein